MKELYQSPNIEIKFFAEESNITTSYGLDGTDINAQFLNEVV